MLLCHMMKNYFRITPNLLRFSVGIEHVDDLISELDFAMNHN